MTIKESIVSGNLPPGERLVIRDLAHRLRVSETPVRVALARLASDGLVDQVSHIGATVSPIHFDELKDIHAIIGALQGLAAERAAVLITPEEASQLRFLLETLEHLPADAPYTEFSSFNLTFHRTIAAISGYAALGGLTDELFEKLQRARTLWLLPAHRERARQEHRDVLQAIEDKLPLEARRLMEQHWLRSGRDFVAEMLNRQLLQPQSQPRVEDPVG